jgi:hypothetical protein
MQKKKLTIMSLSRRGKARHIYVVDTTDSPVYGVTGGKLSGS